MEYRVENIFNKKLPEKKMISAVFLIAIEDGQLLCGKNERGWDIPGGHLDDGEDIVDGLKREVREETGATFENAIPYATLSFGGPKVMLFFAVSNYQMGEFTPSEDALEVGTMSVRELLERYHGNKEMMETMLRGAEEVLSS